jgi:RNA polymerase sigma factor (sigma-70 family)
MSSPTLSDLVLVEAARRCDRVAWERLIRRYDPLIRTVCRAHRLHPPDADDVRQTTWLKALEHVDRLNDPRRIRAWLVTVARRECLRTLQQKARMTPSEDAVLDRVPDAGATPEDRILAAERCTAVRRAVAALTPRDRRFLGLLYHDGEPTYAEISHALGMPVGSIGPTRGRVLDRVRRGEDLAALMAVA